MLDRSLVLEMAATGVENLKDIQGKEGPGWDAWRADLKATLTKAGQDLHERVKRQIIKQGHMDRPAAILLMLANFLQSDRLDFDSLELLFQSLGVEPLPDLPARGHPLDDLSPWVIRDGISEK